MNTYRLLSSLFLCGLLAACAAPRVPAPIIERPLTPGVKAPEPARPVVVATPKPIGREADRRGQYIVKRGDTVIHIALEFGLNYQDLIAWNNLANPNDIKVDQVLRVTPPEGGTVAPGVQTAPVASAPAASVRPLTPGAPAAGTPAADATPLKTGPRGEKRAYSEAAMADLQKPESSAPSTQTAPVVAKAEPASKPPVEKPAEAPAADDDGISWMWPTEGKILGGFDDTRKGIDIAGTAGQQVVAAAAGKVLYANSIRGYGNLVIVKHTNNLLSAYAHNKTILVKENQTVAKGQKIAEMGNSDSDAVKLHFEIRQQGKPVDPAKFLPGR